MEFSICNPSNYERDDYVDVDLETLGIPAHLGEKTLKLSRLDAHGNGHEIPFQIDEPFGKEAKKRTLTFLSGRTPPGSEDYSAPSATFRLEEGKPSHTLPAFQKANLWVGHYYTEPKPGEPDDGFSRAWDPERNVTGVKLANGALEFYLSLVAHPRFLTPTNYCGAVTSVVLSRADKMTDPQTNVLAPFPVNEEARRAYWGQITKLAFFRLPWEQRWYHTEDLLKKHDEERKYELVCSHTGAIRAVATLRSEPITIDHICSPYLMPERIEIRCRLYRVIYVYPEREYYTEELFVRTEEGRLLSFRAYYSSHLAVPGTRQNAKFEHIPDYFAAWRHFATFARGYGFACDTHCRERKIDTNDLTWRLQLSPVHKCVHYFMFEGYPHGYIDPFHTIGHLGWYERVLKPIEVIPLSRYISPDA